MHTSLHGPGRRTVDRDEEMVRHRHHWLGLRIAYRGKFPFPTQRQALMKLCKLNPGNARSTPARLQCYSSRYLPALTAAEAARLTFGGRSWIAPVARTNEGPFRIPTGAGTLLATAHHATESPHILPCIILGKKIHPQRRHNTGLYPGGREVTDEHSAW